MVSVGGLVYGINHQQSCDKYILYGRLFQALVVSMAVAIAFNSFCGVRLIIWDIIFVKFLGWDLERELKMYDGWWMMKDGERWVIKNDFDGEEREVIDYL